MQRIIQCLSLVFIFSLAGCGSTGEAILKDLGSIYGQAQPTEQEIGQGLKQALEVGLGRGAEKLSLENGYFANQAIRILLPPEAAKVEQTLRSMGLNKLCDDLILRLNRAAEAAAGKAKPIFVNAIRQMSWQDASGILFGPEDAATEYLRKTTSAQLRNAFQPVIKESLEEVNAVSLWNQVFSRYNQLPMVKKINPDLDAYVTSRALEGLFHSLSLEEKKIRENPLERSTELIRKVFGYKDRKSGS